jgi:hypothetical protein
MPIMKPILRLLRVGLALCALKVFLDHQVALRAADISAVWGGGSGEWSVAGNWTPNANHPNNGNGGLTYNARVSSGTVTLTEPISIQQYTNAGGTLTGDFPLTVNELFTWSGGTISGNASIHASGGASLLGGTKTLTGRTLDIGGGNATWSAGNISSGSGAVLSVQPGADFDAGFDGTLNVNPAGTTTVSNRGTFRKTGGTGNSGTVINAIFHNQPGGQVRVSNGLLTFNQGGNSSGAFDVTAGTTLGFGGGDHVLDAAATVSGAGTNRLTAGSLGMSGSYDLSLGGTMVSGGSMSFNGPDPRPGNVFVSGNGNLSFNSGGPPVPLAGLNMTGGTLGGADSFEVSGGMIWGGGTISGTGVILPLDGLTLAGAGTKTLSGRTLSLPGGTTSTWLQGSLNGGLGAVLNLEPLAEFNSAFDGTFNVAGGGTTTITNRGTFRKTAGTGVTSIEPLFINLEPGLVESVSGTLSLNSGGGGDGTYAVSSGATLRFGGGNHNLGIAARVEGSGTNSISAGIVTVGGSYAISGGTLITGGTTSFAGTVANLGDLIISGNPTVSFDTGSVIPAASVTLSGGTLGGGDTLQIAGPFRWSGGRIDGAGLVEVNGGAVFTGTAGKNLNARTLNLSADTTLWNSGNMNSGGGAVLNNAAELDINFDGTFSASLGGSSTINNSGTIRKSGGIATTTLAPVFNNASGGRLEVEVGTVSLTGGGSSSGEFEIAANSTLVFGGGNHSLDAASSITGAGTNAITAGALNIAGNYHVTGGTRVTGGGASFSGPVTGIGALAVSGGTAAFVTGDAVQAATTTVSAGTLSTDSPLNIAGAFDWTGGTISGTGLIQANGPTTWSGFSRTLNGRMHLNAPATWSAGNINSGQSAALTIGEQVVLNTTFDGSYSFGGGGSSVITNRGTFRKSGGVGANGTVINAVFNNGPGASVDLASGTLSLDGGGSSGGAFIVANGATLRFGGGAHFLNSASSVSGAGTNRFTSGSTTLEGPVSVTGGIVVSGGNVTFAGPVTGEAPLTISGGQVDFNGSSSITFAAATLSGGIIGGANDLTFTGPFNWTGGTLSGSGVVTADGGATFANNAHTLAGRTLRIPTGRTAAWTAGDFTANQNATLEIDGTLEIGFDGRFFNGFNGTATISNSGTIRKNGGNAIATIGVTLDNNGTLEVNSGRLDLFGGGTSAGSFMAAANGTLAFISSFGSATHQFGADSSIGGAGTVRVEGGTLNFGGTFDVAGTCALNGGSLNFTPGARIRSLGSVPTISGATVKFDTGADVGFPSMKVSAGSLGGSDTINVTNLFTWTGGSLNGNSAVNALGGAAMDAGSRSLIGQRLNLYGMSAWGTGDIGVENNAVFHIQPGATLVNSFDGHIGGIIMNGGITNAGTFRKTGGSGATSFSSRLDNLGTIEINSGLLDFSFAQFVQTTGSTILNGGNLNVGLGFELLGGSLTGAGTVSGFITNAATVNPGSPIGILSLKGDLIQGQTGIVNIDLGGTSPGIDHDQINLTPPGTAALAGTLHVSLINGFLPNVGDSFRVLTYGFRNGAFNTLSGFDLGVSDRHLEAVYDSTGLTLVTREGPLSTDGPTLSMRWLPPDTLELTWPDQYLDFNLESTTNLAIPGWQPFGTPGINEVFIVIDPAETERYFRLKGP